jgi:hypothetical protein
MTTLHLNLEDADNALSLIRDRYGAMCAALDKIRAQIHSSLEEGHGWYSASANEFYEAFDTSDSDLCARLNELDKLGKILEKEKDQWTAAASHLHPGGKTKN